MDLNRFAKDVHRNAVDHGWWDGGERPASEIIALIHSEWSEALEEYRNGCPMAYVLRTNETGPSMVTNVREWKPTEKPEGIAVELLDGCIRIYDWLAGMGKELFVGTLEEASESQNYMPSDMPLPALIAMLHYTTSKAFSTSVVKADAMPDVLPLEIATNVVYEWLAMNGVNAEELLVRKHNYNRSRPYRHGGKRC